MNVLVMLLLYVVNETSSARAPWHAFVSRAEDRAKRTKDEESNRKAAAAAATANGADREEGENDRW